MKRKYIKIIACMILLFVAFNNIFVETCNTGHAYHKIFLRHTFCYGLNNCRSGTEITTIFKAKSIGRTPCHFCYGR